MLGENSIGFGNLLFKSNFKMYLFLLLLSVYVCARVCLCFQTEARRGYWVPGAAATGFWELWTPVWVLESTLSSVLREQQALLSVQLSLGPQVTLQGEEAPWLAESLPTTHGAWALSPPLHKLATAVAQASNNSTMEMEARQTISRPWLYSEAQGQFKPHTTRP